MREIFSFRGINWERQFLHANLPTTRLITSWNIDCTKTREVTRWVHQVAYRGGAENAQEKARTLQCFHSEEFGQYSTNPKYPARMKKKKLEEWEINGMMWNHDYVNDLLTVATKEEMKNFKAKLRVRFSDILDSRGKESFPWNANQMWQREMIVDIPFYVKQVLQGKKLKVLLSPGTRAHILQTTARWTESTGISCYGSKNCILWKRQDLSYWQ
jgi:hypothetical protein